ncbi:MAG: TIGR01906 family membrane protein [Anaerolineae bacterium]|nr:MAG: TIGR01906 family membrane protein [Anaerolineae bacterium]
MTRFLTSLLIPPALILTTVWAMLHPWFLTFEYNTPGFPDDPYGFTKTERLHWARYAVDYLRNDADISYLGDLRFPEGQQVPPLSCMHMDDCTRLYNERELQHMVDVKNVVRGALRVWQVSLLSLLVLGVWAWRAGQLDEFRLAVARGGWWTVGFAAFIILFVLVGFGVIFVWFHEIFFASGTWMFYYSDTLIRLFPERFWRDAFLMVAGVPALTGALLGRFLPSRG